MVTSDVIVVPLFGPRSAADDAGFGLAPAALAGWKSWLIERIEPDWRAAEWDARTLLFTGDVDNPATVVYRCAVAACDGLAYTQGLCSACGKAFKATELTLREFRAGFVPDRNRTIEGFLPRCRVQGCPRESHVWDLCTSHASLRTKAAQRSPGAFDLESWVAGQKAYDPAEPCLVPACRYDARPSDALCRAVHAPAWREQCQERGLVPGSAPDPAWLERQAPYLMLNQFSLAPLHEVARLEVLYALQQRDARGQKIDPTATRQAVAHLAKVVECVAAIGPERLPRRAAANVDALVRETHRVIYSAFGKFQGIDPGSRAKLDLTELGVKAVRGGRTYRPGNLDVSGIRQEWLRTIYVRWVDEGVDIDTSDARRGLRAGLAAARALDARPGGGHDVALLGFADINAVVEMFRNLLRLDGQPMGAKTRSGLMGVFFAILDHGRLAGHLGGMNAAFSRHRSHVIERVEVNEDTIGKAVPESVIFQMNDYLDLLGRGIRHGRMNPEQVHAMAQVVYKLLRDTGRRPNEIAGLKLDCLELVSGDWYLVWDNTKARRLGRRLPIHPPTAHAVHEWIKVRGTMDLPAGSEQFLLPPAGDRGRIRHMVTEQVWGIIRTFADGIPALWAEGFGQDGDPLPFDRSLIYPYAFRHSFCQRHADAGVKSEFLAELMDHDSTATTSRYY